MRYSSLAQHNNSKKILVSFKSVSFLMLCAYCMIISLSWIEWVPEILNTLTLYGFVLVAAVSAFQYGILRIGRHVVFYAVFMCFCLLSCLYAPNVEDSMTVIYEMLKILIFSLMLFGTVDSRDKIETLMKVTSIAVAIVFFYLAATGQLEMEENERLGQELAGNANSFATIFMMGAICSTYFVCFGEKPFWKLSFFSIFVLQEYALALSGGRKFFLLPIAILCGMILFYTDKRRKDLLFRVFFAVAATAVLFWALFNVDMLYDSIGYRFESFLNKFTGKGEVDASTAIRDRMTAAALELWEDSPLAGHGINSFKELSTFNVYAHNNYAELLCDVGIIGTALYYAYHLWLLFKLINLKKGETKKWFWILLVGGILVFDVGAVSYYMVIIHLLLILADIYIATGFRETNFEYPKRGKRS